MKLPRLVRSILAKAFGVMSFLTLLFILFVVPVPLGMAALLNWIPNPSLFTFFILIGVSVAIGIAVGLLPGVALSRFLLRIWPINASGAIRKRCLHWQRRVAYVAIALILLQIASFILQRIHGEGIFSSGSEFGPITEEYVVSVIAVWAAWMATITVGAGLSSWVHAHPRYYVDGTFILYLRRFSSFADRSVVSEVLRATPRGARVVFIASPQGQARNWDPFVWSFSGLRPLHPFNSLPVQLRTSDEDWAQAVASLVAKAATVVMDISESSVSIEKEIRMVAQGANPERVLWLVDWRSKQSTDVDWVADVLITSRKVLAYQRRWYWVSLVAKTALFAFVAYEIFFWVAALPKMAKGENEFSLTLVLILIALLGTWLLVGLVLLFRPSIDRGAKKKLKHGLSLAVSSATKGPHIL